MPIPGRFPTGMKIFQIPLSWFRKVTAWLNNFCGGPGIDVTHPTDPSDVSPVMVSIDREWLKDEIKNNTIDSDHLGKGTGASATATDATTASTGNSNSLSYAPTLDTTTWAADSGVPLNITVFRFVPATAASGKYGFLCARTLGFSPNGRLVSMSAEVNCYRVAVSL